MHYILDVLTFILYISRMKRKGFGSNETNKIRKYAIKIFLLHICFFSIKGYCQSGEITVNALAKMGFENVSWNESDKERVFAIENSAYRLSGIGIAKAIDQIQQTGLPLNKSCRIIVLNNNVPLISLYYCLPNITDTVARVSRKDWEVSYDLGKSWDRSKRKEIKNSSLYKVDIVVYPDFSFQNLIITQVYQVLFNLSPAIEVSLWKGMKLTGQMIFPIYNEYGSDYEQIRQGYITLSQSVRLPQNVFLTAAVGTFNNRRWGADLKVKHYLKKDERFSVEARIGYTGVSYFEDLSWHVSPLKRITWTLGGSFYWPRYNTLVSLKAEQYLLGEKGVRFDVMRNFRYTSIGFYAMKAEHAPKNGGFYFQIALPPYGKYKRNHVRVTPAKYFGISYNAGNERYYGKSYVPELGTTYAYENIYNPYFIKSELLNY